MSGRVGLADGLAPDGVKIKLQVDLDRNGKLESYETLSASVRGDGNYTVDYELDPRDVDLEFVQFAATLVADYQARGFEALLDDGPLPVLLTFEREGYSSVVKRLNTLFEAPSFDVLMAPLPDVQCATDACSSADGGVLLSGFPGGTKIARAYADAYDPSLETARFPGLFADASNNLLISSGFAEINLYDETGKAIHGTSSPVSVRFEAKRPSWSTLPDLEPNSGRIELPMYSFDTVTGEWVAEADGELQLADGSVVGEDELPAIHAGTFTESVFVAFETKHFSTFNCDAPIEERACVKGRLVTEVGAKAVAGLQVSVNGVNYTGSAGLVITGTDGTFAVDVMKSELPNEDVDRNGRRGETFEARVVATGAGVFTGEAFETPTEQASVGRATRPGCRGADCECLDLGDIAVNLEEPRLCEITVDVSFSGRHFDRESGPFVEGDKLVGAQVSATLAGGIQVPYSLVEAACQTGTCGPGVAPDDGVVTFAVPVIGEAPQIQIDGTLRVEAEGKFHYYTASLTVPGCTREEEVLAEPVALEADHAELGDLGSFIAALGDGPSVAPPRVDNPLNPFDDESAPAKGCGCRLAGADRSATPLTAMLAALAALGLRGRRRKG
jgi:MYXO-CTERM domain-containing protein